VRITHVDEENGIVTVADDDGLTLSTGSIIKLSDDERAKYFRVGVTVHGHLDESGCFVEDERIYPAKEDR
jgi:hypothetical protein